MQRIAFVFLVAVLVPAAANPQTIDSPVPSPRTQEQPSAGVPRPGLPPRDTPGAAKPASGRIRGRVIAADTGVPLRRAQILLTSGQLGVRRFTTTDAEGRYEFAEMGKGRYTITASSGSYVALQYGQRRAFEPGRPLALADGQIVSQVDFALPRGSVITGRITDDLGDPLPGVFVQVRRYQYAPNGQRRLTFGGGTGLVVTDDLGQFRAYGLMPGEIRRERHAASADVSARRKRQRRRRRVHPDVLPWHHECRRSGTCPSRTGTGDVDPIGALRGSHAAGIRRGG